MTPQDIADKASDYAFGKRIILNNLRSIVVETIISIVLPEWKWCGGDWAAWDFEHLDDGTRLEVKQAAAKQTWETTKPPRPSFDIRPRTGRYEGSKWTRSSAPERFAHIYIFAFHPRDDPGADHRDPSQWEFYVVPTAKLPTKNAFSLVEVRASVNAVSVIELAKVIESARVDNARPS
jgi:hypothetical protein